MASGNKDRSAKGAPGGLAVGQKLGKYEIVEQLGVGGQSIVYKGFDSMLERHVAIKQVAPHLAADEKFIKRFREVARRLAKLHCEEVVTIHELMDDPRGLFVVMEFVEGHSIETTLASQAGAAEAKATLQIIWRIAAGLAAIHKTGVIHRDIKPGNIIVGEGLRLKITDFGVAAQAGAPASMRLGTTKYMAPELFSGDEVTQQADVYSLGMIAYEMLLGREKFNEVFADIVRDPHSEALRWMKWHSSDAKPPLLSEVDESVPAPMSAIVARMLAKDPADRYANVEALGKDIRANFSPRAQAPARRSRRRKGRRSAKAADEAEATPADVLADTGGSLTLTPGPPAEPATAAIPKEPVSAAKKLAIVGTVVGAFLVALLAWQLKEAADRDTIARQAQGDFDKAHDVYSEASRAPTAAEKNKLFNEAADGFAAVIKDYRPAAGDVCAKAEANEHLARGYAMVMAGQLQKQDYAERDRLFRAADDYLERARRLVNRLEREEDSLYEWAQRMISEIRQFERSRDDVRRYLRYMREAGKAMAEGNLDEAEAVLVGSAKPAAKSDEEKSEVEALRQRIMLRRQRDTYTQHIRQAVAMAKENKIAEAAAAYDEAAIVVESIRQSLSEQEYKDMKQEAEAGKVFLLVQASCRKGAAQAAALEKRDRLRAADQYRQVAASVRQAKGSLPADQYAELTGKYSPEALTAKADGLAHDHWLKKGYEDLEAGRIGPAQENFRKAQKLKDSSAARVALDTIEKRKNYQAVLGKAESLYRAKSYEAAREQFREARKYPGSDSKHIQSRITNCDYHVLLAKAQAAKAQRKWADARRYYRQARRVNPSGSATVDALLEELARERLFVELMDAADRAAKARDWSDAVAKLQDAQKLRPRSAQVDLKLKEVRYEEQLEMGQTAMKEAKYGLALAHFKQAKRFKPTPAIDKLIATAEELKEGEEEQE